MTNRKLFSIIFITLFAESISIAFVYDTFWEAIIIGLPALIVPLYLMKVDINSPLTKHACAIATMIFASLHIHQMNGMIEAHFEIFILMACLITFNHWKVFLSALSVVAIHHISFYFLQKNNAGVYIFNSEDLLFSIVILHIIYASFEAIIAGFVAKKLHDDRLILTNQEELLKLNNQTLEMEVSNRTKDLEKVNKQISQYSNTIEQDKIKLEIAYSELIKFQQELVEKEKFSQLGKLIAGVSHEMNTPLGIAITTSSVIDEEIGDLINKVNSQQLTKKYLHQFSHRTQEANNILGKNLDKCVTLISAFQQISTDKNISEINPTKILDYTKEIFTTLGILLKKENISYNIQGYNTEIMIEAGLLSQVITNLVTNAIKHAFHNKEGDNKITVFITEQKKWVTLEFKDNGYGMPEKALAHIFEPFFTTKRNKGGTGLGMNIVYNLVTQSLGGNITVNSQLGSGTSIFIQLPRVKVAESII